MRPEPAGGPPDRRLLFHCRRGREDNSPHMTPRFFRHWRSCGLALGLAASLAFAEGPYRNRDNPDAKDLMEGTYPVPYQKPTVAEITADLVRVRTFLETAMPARLVDRQSGQPITDLANPVATGVADRGEAGSFGPFLLRSRGPALRHAERRAGDRRPRVLRLYREAVPVPFGFPPLLPGPGRQIRGGSQQRPDPPCAQRPGRLRRHDDRADPGPAGRGGSRSPSPDQFLDRLHRAQAVPAARRLLRPPSADGRLHVGG